jgi:hypothetical protein
MVPGIAIDQSTFERLQRHAKPFVDTPDTVVNRALDALERRKGPASAQASTSSGQRRIDPQDLPNLRHTKILQASLDGNRVTKPNWNMLLERVLNRATIGGADRDELSELCPVNMVQGRKEDEGYRYLEELDVSIQGMSANDACRALVVAAQSIAIQVEIVVMWRAKEGAAFPGEKARLHIASGRSRS